VADGDSGSRSAFPAIGDYGFLSDCHTGALVAPDGSVEWLCLPRFDSPSVFTAILDRGAGSFRFGPTDVTVPVARRYVPGTNILETTWMCEDGWVVIRDALTVEDWREGGLRTSPRPPTSHDSAETLLRSAECVQGEVELELLCDLAYGYGSARPTWSLDGDRQTTAVTSGGDPEVRVIADWELGVDGDAVAATRRLSEGERCFCGLAWGTGGGEPTDVGEVEQRFKITSDFWRQWLGDGRFPDHPWRGHLQRSALTLKGLTYSPTGAVVAAATTSLPETPGGERNWDYRYTWIRDATFALWAMHTLGFDLEASDFAAFVRDVCHAEDLPLQIMYGIGGERELTERTLDRLSGYGGARPVRIGNAAFSQRQNDVYGALLDSVYIHTKSEDRLLDRGWALVKHQVEEAVRVWREPDQGIWEARGEPKHYVSSKIMCWVALDRGARLARRRSEETELAERWSGIADEIRAEILDRGVSRKGVLRQHYDTDALDASTLLAPLVRFLPADDERIRATVLAVAEELTENGLVLRYRTDQTDDGLSGVEGTFTICSFWLVAALSEIGEQSRARALCERLLSFAGPLGLYAEEIEPRSGTQLGNFPQAFTHLALVNAVSHVMLDDLVSREPEQPTAAFSEMQALHQRGGGRLRQRLARARGNRAHRASGP
jgi:alpha,alpha-trehalase